LGPSRERTANGRRSSAGQHRVHSCDRRKGLGGATSARPGASRVPHSVSRHCHGDSSRAEYARRKVESSFWSGGWIAAQLRPPGTGCSPANGTPEELRRLARPCVLSIALPLRFYYDLPKRPPKISGCLRIERNTNILGRPATGRVTSRRIVPESAKRHPNSCDKVARLRSYEIRVGLRTRSLLTAVMVHTGL